MNRSDIQIIIHTKKDKDGNQSFSAEWISDNIGPNLSNTGIRSQCYYTNIEKFTSEREQRGKRVTIVPECQSKLGYVLINGTWVKYDVKSWHPVS